MRAWMRDKMAAYQELTTATGASVNENGDTKDQEPLFTKFKDKLSSHLDFKAVELRS